MLTSGLNHFTIRCAPEDLPGLVAFYGKFIHLVPGPRPEMPFPGSWLYSEGKPIVHLFACLKQTDKGPTGALDHVSFSAHGLEETRAFLKAEGMPYDDIPVNGLPLQQIFVRDPNGLKIELTFDLTKELELAHAKHG